MPRLSRFLTGALACSAATIVLASTASATTTTGTLIEPHNNKYVSNGDYGIRSDDFGSLTILNNNGERGFTVTRSTASGPRVTAYPNVFRGWQWGVGTNGAWPLRVSDAGTPGPTSRCSRRGGEPTTRRSTYGALFITPCYREEEKPAGGIKGVIVRRVRAAIVGVKYLPVLEVSDKPFDWGPERGDLGVVFFVGHG